MKKLLVVILMCVLCGGCQDDHVCIIEYMDGETEVIYCYNAYVKDTLFCASGTTLCILKAGGVDHKALCTIKRWRLERKDGGK